MKFKTFCQELNEKLITFGGKAYPKFGQVVILSGGAGCFTGDTKVKTNDGLKEIKDIKIGDKVLSYNEITKEKEFKSVTNTFDYANDDLLKLTFDNGEIIECTPSHKFLINGKWVEAKDLPVESYLRKDLFKMKLVSKEIISREERVYDIEVEDNHNYCLTNNEIIVHNSGKGFVRKNLLGIEGKVLDVDRLKELVIGSIKIKAKILDKFGIDVSKISLKNPDEVSALHDIVSELDLTDKTLKTLLISLYQAKPERKPNIIFDVTLKDLTKFYNIIRQVKDMGYYSKNISLIWVLNTIDVSLSQNKTRDRVLSNEILLGTHQGASYTMSELVKMGDKLSNYMDGELVVAFNQEKVDNELKKSDTGGKYVKNADYVYLKRKEKPISKYSEIENDVINKIKRYVPNSKVWES